MRGLDGWSDFGVDFFLFNGTGSDQRYTGKVGNGRGTGGKDDGILSLPAPGPDGPVATEKHEMLRDGMQVAEAILFLRRAVEEKKLPAELEGRVNRCLDERGEASAECQYHIDRKALMPVTGHLGQKLPIFSGHRRFYSVLL